MIGIDATYRTGLLPHAKEKEDRRLGAHLHPEIAAKLAAGPVGHADLSEFLPPVWNQGNCSGCWAHAGASCLFGAHAMAGKHILIPSPLYFMKTHYSRLRGLAFPSGRLPMLMDTGADLDSAAETFKVLGEHPLESAQQDGDTDVPATTDNAGNPIPLPELEEQEVAEGMAAVFDGEYSIPVDSDAPTLLMATLDAKIFVWDGFLVDKACENLGPNDVLGAPGKGLGGHSTLYWGYDLLPSGPVFYKRNSWGRSWCRNGDYTVNEAHVLAAWSLWPFAVKVSP